MGDNSKIEWTDATWPIVQGCDPVSEGCVHCYAVKLLWRLMHNPDPKISGPLQGLIEKHVNRAGETILRFTGKLALRADRLDWPLKWTRPRMIFVPSHGDIFHKDVPDWFLDMIFAVMALCPQHTFQVLTKRDKRMRAYCSDRQRRNEIELAAEKIRPGTGAMAPKHTFAWPLPNVWLGVSAERQEEAEERIPTLLQTPAAVRFASLEPLLGPIDLTMLVHDNGQKVVDATNGCYAFKDGDGWEQAGQGYSLKWVIDGGESGSDRLYDIDASRALEAQCVDNGVAYFRKQLGAHPFERRVSGWPNHIAVGEDSAGRRLLTGFNHKKAGDADEWPADLRRREFPKMRVS